MTLTVLLIRIAITAAILTLLVEFGFKKRKNWLMSYAQNFAGALFIFSGWVKAVDPLGTAYKMKDYFAEFETHFTWFSGIFPVLAEFSVAFAVIMIVLEIVLGIMLILGSSPKLTSWLFFIIVAFFTVLTGFTYLTGYLPEGATFFEFGKWGEYVKTNMKVTDCGCFGDYIKLEPKTSFFKDIFLLFPAVYFLFQSKKMHQLFTPTIRSVVFWVSTIGVTLYCFNNYAWDIPKNDFRPFKNGVNILDQKAIEEEAAANAEVNYVLTNKASGEKVSLSMDKYLAAYKDYPKDAWDIDQQRAEPAIPSTKISEFEVSDVEGNDVSEMILTDPNYSFVIVSYKLYHETDTETVVYNDTTFRNDTIIPMPDSMIINQEIVSIDKKQRSQTNYIWDKEFTEIYKNTINPLAEAAEKAGLKTSVLTAYADPAMIDDFRHEAQTAYPFYTGDDIMLKTIVRSNPGVILMKNGTIIKKWHHKKVPSFSEIQQEYMK